MTDFIKKKILKGQFMSYGFLPFVYLIRDLEKEERYEDCQLLKGVIEEMSEMYDFPLPTEYSKEAVDLFFSGFDTLKTNGRVAFSNVPHYALELRMSISSEEEKREIIKARAKSFLDSFFDDLDCSCV